MRFVNQSLFFILSLFTSHVLFSDMIQKESSRGCKLWGDLPFQHSLLQDPSDDDSIHSMIQEKDPDRLRVLDCLLPKNHFLQSRLSNLFNDPDMFESPEHLRENGFEVIDRLDRRLMVASHPKLKNYLIKKFLNEVPRKRQLRNYLSRINGAENLRHFIKLNKLQYIVTPKKWLYRLPIQFSNPKNGKYNYILIVEKMDICSSEDEFNEEIANRYYNIRFDILRELCIVLYRFRGLDSALRNMPFTHQNKIAFIDTECWDCQRDGFLERVMPFMSKDRQDYALGVFEELVNDKPRN